MRNVFAILAVALLALVGGRLAAAAVIVDTGTPSGTPEYGFDTRQYFAGKFTVLNSVVIDSVEGYFSNFNATAGTITIAIHADGGEIPDAALFSSVGLTVPPGAPLAWRGLSGAGWSLNPGTYWASFTPGDTVSGTMPGTAPSPMIDYALFDGFTWSARTSALAVWVRINSFGAAPVPEPTSLALWGIGALGCAVAARRRKLAA
jgi:hypothetical protein